MKQPPKMPACVERGLKDIAALAQSDVDADRANDAPEFVGRRYRDVKAAFAWLASINRPAR